MRQKGIVGIFVLVLILAIAVAGGAYYLGRSTSPKLSATLVTNSQIPQPTPVATPASSPDKTTTWKTYVSSPYNPFWSDEELKKVKAGGGYANEENIKHIQLLVRYPPDWKQEGDSSVFSKGNFEISIALGYAPGGNRCSLAPDFNSAPDINSQFATLKRVKAFEGETIKAEYTMFTLCSDEAGTDNSKTFGTNTSVGKIHYLLPETYTSQDLATMDKIISTVKKTRLPY